MKIKLKLNRNQYKGVATIAQNCCNALSGISFEEVQYRDALRSLVLKMASRVPTLRDRNNSLTLGEMESLALWRTVNDLVMEFQPYEMSLGFWMLGEIDQQRGRYITLMKANLGVQQSYLGR